MRQLEFFKGEDEEGMSGSTRSDKSLPPGSWGRLSGSNHRWTSGVMTGFTPLGKVLLPPGSMLLMQGLVLKGGKEREGEGGSHSSS